MHSVRAESLDEFSAAGVRLAGDLDDGGSQRELRAGRKIVLAEIEVDEQLIARERPTVLSLSEQRDRARVDDVQLHIGMRRSICRPAALSLRPAVAYEAGRHVELRFVENFARANPRAPNDQVEHAVVFWRLFDSVKTGFDLVCTQMPHAHSSIP